MLNNTNTITNSGILKHQLRNQNEILIELSGNVSWNHNMWASRWALINFTSLAWCKNNLLIYNSLVIIHTLAADNWNYLRLFSTLLSVANVRLTNPPRRQEIEKKSRKVSWCWLLKKSSYCNANEMPAAVVVATILTLKRREDSNSKK
jgi:hypothetical protein